MLNNFAIIKRMDMLGLLIGQRGRWSATVAKECRDGASSPGLENMAAADAIFGDLLYPLGAERVDIAVLRDKMAEQGDAPNKHLGEAETLVIMQRQEFQSSFFVTDDLGARREAKRVGITSFTTWDILRLLVRGRRLDLADFHVDAEMLIKMNRGRPPGWPNRATIEQWLISG